MLWLSTERSNCHFNCANFRLPWVRSLHWPSKKVFLFFDANSLDRQHSERAHAKRKVSQLKRQQFLFLDSQSICELKEMQWSCDFHHSSIISKKIPVRETLKAETYFTLNASHCPLDRALQVYFAPSSLNKTAAILPHHASTPFSHPLGSSRAEQTLATRMWPSISTPSLLAKSLYRAPTPALQYWQPAGSAYKYGRIIGEDVDNLHKIARISI